MREPGAAASGSQFLLYHLVAVNTSEASYPSPIKGKRNQNNLAVLVRVRGTMEQEGPDAQILTHWSHQLPSTGRFRNNKPNLHSLKLLFLILFFLWFRTPLLTGVKRRGRLPPGFLQLLNKAPVKLTERRAIVLTKSSWHPPVAAGFV